jgi:hypothetical protein
VTAWTSLLVATPASPSAQQERDLEQKTQDIFGPSSQAEFAFFDPSSVSSRTSKDTSVLDSEKSLENWNQWVTRCRGEYSLRVKLAHHTNASEFLSWPTVTANEDSYRIGGETQQSKCLSAMARRGEMDNGLPAPANPSTLGSRQGLSAEAWPTPTARDHKSGRGNEEREYKELTPMVERTQSGKLNPRWVETLMGLPVGWTMPSCTRPVTIELTNCASSATESSQQPQSELLELF